MKKTRFITRRGTANTRFCMRFWVIDDSKLSLPQLSLTNGLSLLIYRSFALLHQRPLLFQQDVHRVYRKDLR
ncbi:hypothetical protein PAXRUDRAFT_642870 [Paxillus rubicundulus Ve08.2h10]|uniref:Uncharacterized protein n=1 Tax=Paxillus rubicundulus Ve08.2h10 TaxID=930991 RepID=A0A0D0DSK8_9AGAM|nr:hypothetical protein PAXRUDRAFT_642870 [Paxillus rubicundulus Ve08.2h10]